MTPAEKRVLDAVLFLPESTLAFWKATRHVQGFDPAIEFIDAVVAWRGELEKARLRPCKECRGVGAHKMDCSQGRRR